MSSNRENEELRIVETSVPLDGLAETATELIELYGGSVESSDRTSIDFKLPSRRGVSAAGGVRCRIDWTEGEGGFGELRLTSGEQFEGPSLQRIVLLVAGLAGSLVCILWPFFPSLTPVAGVGAVLAIGAYLLTLKRSGANVAADLLFRIAKAQKSKEGEKSAE
jgi:hypothetical protein